MNLLIAVLGTLAVLVSIGVKVALALRARTPRAARADDADNADNADDLAWLRAGPWSDTLSRTRHASAAPRHVPARRPRRTAPDCAARERMPAVDSDAPAA